MTAKLNSISIRLCAKCGTANRAKDGKCIPCTKVTKAAYRAKNKEKIKAYNKLYAASLPDFVKANKRAYDLKRISRASVSIVSIERKAYILEWRKKNVSKTRVYRQNRRAIEKQSGGVISDGLFSKLFKLQRGKCACCDQPLGEKIDMDHIMPLKLGGIHADSNIQLLRARCNRQKNSKHPVDFMQSRGFLL